MLSIQITEQELFDESTNQFIYVKKQTLQLEHSLISISKWESKWTKPFLVDEEKTYEELIDYIKCMTITQNVDPAVYSTLTREQFKEINDYIMAPMTATTFNDSKKKNNRETVTSELIYYWMITLNIPVEFEKWHIKRLLTLIKVCDIKNTPAKKMSKSELYRRNSALNAQRRKALGSRG